MSPRGAKCAYTVCTGKSCSNWLWDAKLRRLPEDAVCAKCDEPWHAATPPWRGGKAKGGAKGEKGKGGKDFEPTTKELSDEELLSLVKARGFGGSDALTSPAAPALSPKEAAKASNSQWRTVCSKLGAAVAKQVQLEQDIADSEKKLAEKREALVEEQKAVAALRVDCEKALASLESDSRRAAQAASTKKNDATEAGPEVEQLSMEVDSSEPVISEEALDLELVDGSGLQNLDQGARAEVKAFIMSKFSTFAAIRKRPAPDPADDGDRKEEARAARAEYNALMDKAKQGPAVPGASPAVVAASLASAVATSVAA